ncbi:MAG: FAD-dependent oxidoreductase [Pseudohongiellaceae bacterium]
MSRTKLLLLGTIAVALAAYVLLDLDRYLTLEYAQSQLDVLRQFRDENFLLTAGIYFLVYVSVAALSIPGATPVTLLGGAIFGLLWGTVIVSFASTIGATLAFLISRTLLRNWVQKRFGRYLAPINRGIERDGSFYLFSIRMIPLFPFFVVNLLMGLMPIRVLTFYLVSQVGMLMGTLVYVNAGVQLGQIESLSGLVSGNVILSLVLLGLLPLAARWVVGVVQRNKVLRKYPKPKRFDANVVVIGAGSAGLVASLIAAGAKAKVILVEKHKMGGDCLNTGCVPSKSLIRSGRIMSYIRRASEFGIDGAAGEVNFSRVMARVRDVIKAIEPHDSVERYESLGVECVSGSAHIESPYIVRVGERQIHTRSIILATGARPAVPPIPGLDSVDYLTSDTVWGLEELPPHLLVVGGGPIGCELAQAFSNLGSRVTQVDRAPRIMPREDPEVSELVTAQFRQQGIDVLTDHELKCFGRDGETRYMEAEHEGETVRIEFDRVLLALGRKPNVEGFGLEELDMPLTDSGAINVNDAMQTAFPNIFACGDVAGPYQFTHMASFQAFFAAGNSLLGGLWRLRSDYRVVPWATFIDPEVAHVGLNETEAKDGGIDYEITRYEFDDQDRALADGEARGFVKVLTVPGKDRILGATIVGYHAGELIGEFVFAMTHKMGLKKIAAVTHIYPTLLEANKFAANAWRNERLPTRLFPLAERFFRWQRRAPAPRSDK